MKLRSVAIQGFRGFCNRVALEFGDTNVLGGPNGYGKTSLFDAFEWCLFGSILRLSGTRDFSRAGDIFRNKFFSGTYSVGLEFHDEAGNTLKRFRASHHCHSEINGRTAEDEDFFTHLGLDGDDGHNRFLRNFLLQQEKLSEFVRDLNPRNRYDSMVSLLELATPQNLLGRIQELTALTEATGNKVSIQLQSLQERIKALQGDVDKLHAVDVDTTSDLIRSQYEELVKEATTEAGGHEEVTGILLSSDLIAGNLRELSEKITHALKEWRDLLRQLSSLVDEGILEYDEESIRKQLYEQELAANSTKQLIAEPEIRIQESETELRSVTSRLEHTKKSVSKLQTLLAEVRQVVTSDQCPVCKRPIPRASLLEIIDKEIGELAVSLNSLLAHRDSMELSLGELRSGRDRLLARLKEHEQAIGELRTKIEKRQKFDSAYNELRSRELPKQKRMTDLSFQQFVAACKSSIETLDSLHERTLRLSNLSDQLNATRLLPAKMSELVNLQRSILEATQQQRLVETVRRLLGHLNEAVIDARSNLVVAFLDSYKPLIRALYTRFSPHLLFTDIDFEVIRAYKESELYFRVYTRNQQTSAYPSTIFSTSQLNALALCIFLALNLRTRGPLPIVMMDDPIQVMDDINVLGFCEIVRQMKGQRQLFISTHDKNLFQLLLNKLRPAQPNEVVKGFRFEAWSETGPDIKEDVVDYKKYEISLQDIKRIAFPPQTAA